MSADRQRQDLGAESDHWRRLARESGPGWRVWRWEEPDPDWELHLIWRFRLLAPDEMPPDRLGVIISR